MEYTEPHNGAGSGLWTRRKHRGQLVRWQTSRQDAPLSRGPCHSEPLAGPPGGQSDRRAGPGPGPGPGRVRPFKLGRDRAATVTGSWPGAGVVPLSLITAGPPPSGLWRLRARQWSPAGPSWFSALLLSYRRQHTEVPANPFVDYTRHGIYGTGNVPARVRRRPKKGRPSGYDA
jgi:hypothetical protein